MGPLNIVETVLFSYSPIEESMLPRNYFDGSLDRISINPAIAFAP